MSGPGAGRRRWMVLGATRGIALVAALGLLILGVAKVTAFDAFVQAVAGHALVPDAAARPFAGLAVALEVLCGVGALWVLLRRASAAAALGVLTTFAGALTLYVGAIALNPPTAPTSCGCGLGAGPVQDWGALLLRNACLGCVLGAAWLGASVTTPESSWAVEADAAAPACEPAAS